MGGGWGKVMTGWVMVVLRRGEGDAGAHLKRGRRVLMGDNTVRSQTDIITTETKVVGHPRYSTLFQWPRDRLGATSRKSRLIAKKKNNRQGSRSPVSIVNSDRRFSIRILMWPIHIGTHETCPPPFVPTHPRLSTTVKASSAYEPCYIIRRLPFCETA